MNAKNNNINISQAEKYNLWTKIYELNLISEQKMRGDLIKTFQIFKGFDNMNAWGYFIVEQWNKTRRKRFEIIGKIFSSNGSITSLCGIICLPVSSMV